MIIISNTAPIIYFAIVGKLSLLRELYLKIYIPFEVWNELMNPVFSKQQKIPPDIKYELEAKEIGWLIVKDPEKEENVEIALNLSSNMGRGEAYAIALSLELSADFLLINDQKAKEIAESMGIKTKWITEILLEAVQKLKIKDSDEFKDIFDKMIEQGLWITKKHYNSALLRAKNLLNDL